jgi:hypothetical protein
MKPDNGSNCRLRPALAAGTVRLNQLSLNAVDLDVVYGVKTERARLLSQKLLGFHEFAEPQAFARSQGISARHFSDLRVRNHEGEDVAPRLTSADSIIDAVGRTCLYLVLIPSCLQCRLDQGSLEIPQISLASNTSTGCSGRQRLEMGRTHRDHSRSVAVDFRGNRTGSAQRRCAGLRPVRHRRRCDRGGAPARSLGSRGRGSCRVGHLIAPPPDITEVTA